MLRQRRLTQAHGVDKATDFHFTFRSEEAKDQQPIFIAEQLQHSCCSGGLLREDVELRTAACASGGFRRAASCYCWRPGGGVHMLLEERPCSLSRVIVRTRHYLELTNLVPIDRGQSKPNAGRQQ